MVIDQDRVEIIPQWSIEYRVCSKCGEWVLTTTLYYTGNQLDVDPLPRKDGYVLVDFVNGNRSKVIPLKLAKKYPKLWMPHIATCKGV